jgi:putative inorganic carbon (hco3(-)) transporter
MRDFAVIIIVLASLPFILVRPHFGILMWFWLSLMNPHRLGWGYAEQFRLSLLVGGVTLVAWLVSKEPKRPPNLPIVYALIAFTIWLGISTIFAIHPEVAEPKWEEVTKILLMTIVTCCMMQSRERIQTLMWIIVISIGFYGVRGGIFTVTTGGNFRVWGPPGSFIADNNELGLAMIMLLPLINYLRSTTANRWVQRGLLATMGLTIIAILGTYSRGALIALSVTLGVFWWKSPQKVLTAIFAATVLGGALMFAPPAWFERMASIGDYQQDASAQGRFEAWSFSYHLALDHPIFGGGMNIYQDPVEFAKYNPTAETNRAIHSVYFQILCDAGFVALGLYLLLIVLSFRTASGIIKLTRDRPDLRWAQNLAAMIQVSILGYTLAGAFLSLGYFDLFYALVAVLAVTRKVVAQAVRGPRRASAAAARFPQERARAAEPAPAPVSAH